MEIPKYIRYDFFITSIGTIIIFYVGYIWIKNLPNEPSDIILFFLFVGYTIFLMGIVEMREDYAIEYNLKRLQYELDKEKLMKEINNRNIDFDEKALMKIRKSKKLKKEWPRKQSIQSF